MSCTAREVGTRSKTQVEELTFSSLCSTPPKTSVFFYFLHTRTYPQEVVLQLHVLVEIQHDIKIIIPYRMFSSSMDENRTIIIMSKELASEEPEDAAVMLQLLSTMRLFCPIWKRNLHPHCYTSSKHSALACCTITRSSLLLLWQGSPIYCQITNHGIHNTIERGWECSTRERTNPVRSSLIVWLVDVHIIDLMCCLLHINLRHSLG